MGFDADPRIETVQEVAVATAPIDSPIGVIEPGLVAARRFHWRALVDGVPVVTATVNWLMGEEHLDPDWSFGPEGERFEVEVTGDPSVKLTFKGLQPETVEAGLVRNPGIVSRPTTASAHPVRRRRRAGHQDLPRPAADRRPRPPRTWASPVLATMRSQVARLGG